MGVAGASSAKMGRENYMKNSVSALSILLITVPISVPSQNLVHAKK
jgi:hypothetical protein